MAKETDGDGGGGGGGGGDVGRKDGWEEERGRGESMSGRKASLKGQERGYKNTNGM